MDQNISVTKPVSAWNKTLKLSFRDFFKSLTKATVQGASGGLVSASKDAIEALSAISLGDDIGTLSWSLIYRALIQAVYTLVQENEALLLQDTNNPRVTNYKLGLAPDDPDAFVNRLDLVLETKTVTIDKKFFEQPQNLELLSDLQLPLSEWLQGFGLDASQATSIANRLPSYFIFALNNQWRLRPDEYAPLKKAFDTPFTKASERDQAWSQYSAWLQKQIDEPMFDEAFSLKQVFVPLRCYYEKKIEGKPDDIHSALDEKRVTEKWVIELKDSLNTWLRKEDARDAVRVISGGPGSGKSSFAKMFAASVALDRNRRVLYIPLHQFEPSDDLIDAVGNFVRLSQLLPHNPIDPQEGESRLLIIFDGLDELAMQGRLAAEIASQFVLEVLRKTEILNNKDASRLKVLITGRDLAIQSIANSFRRPQQILHALPYFVAKQEGFRYQDPQNLLKVDQRQLWWTQYGLANGKRYVGMPNVLMRGDFEEITSQPLLNYLVALSFERGVLDLTKESNLNRIYEDLLSAVYERKWAANPHPATKDIEQEHFIRILEEIAVAAWHGDGRTTTVKEIEEHCEKSGLRVLEALQEGASKGVTRLLMAFYFRQAGSRIGGDRTFEFTHKSFGEYLTARRIVSIVKHLHVELERQKNRFDSTFNEVLALELWLRLCGPVAMDRYILTFIKNQILLESEDEVSGWQRTLCHLIGFILSNGMPMERLSPRPTMKEEMRQSRNAEESLLIVLNICANKNKQVSKIVWPSPTAFGEWISRLQGQRSGPTNGLALECLSFLNLNNCVLDMHDFYEADFSFSELQKARLEYAILMGAILKGADLRGALLNGAILDRADLQRANLQKAYLQDTSIDNTDFADAIFERTAMKKSDLKMAHNGETIVSMLEEESDEPMPYVTSRSIGRAARKKRPPKANHPEF